MKILDTNVFLRLLTKPATPEDVRMQALSSALFESVRAGDEQVTTCEAVLHELFYVLCSPRNYGLSHPEAVARVRMLFNLSGFHVFRKAVISSAIDLFERHEFLDFADCLLAQYADADGHDLTSFDGGYDRLVGVRRFEP